MSILAGFADISLLQLLLVAVVALFAAVVGGLAGYGTGALMPLVLVPLIGAEPVVPIIAISSIFTNLSRATAYRRYVDRRRVLIVIAAATLTTALGAYGYTRLTNAGAALVIGAMLISSVPLRRLLRRHAVKIGDAGLAVDDLSLGGHEAQGTVAQLRDSEAGHRPVGDVELDRHAVAALAVVDAEAAQQGTPLADRQVGRPIVAHFDHVVGEIERLQFAEGPPGAEPVKDQHRQRRPKLVLAARRDVSGREKGRAEDHARPEPLVELALETAVVVRERVQREIGDQRLEPEGDPHGPLEVAGVD